MFHFFEHFDLHSKNFYDMQNVSTFFKLKKISMLPAEKI